MSTENFYANSHIPSFLALFSNNARACARSSNIIQVVQDGRKLSSESLLQGELEISRPILVVDTPESIGMTVFRPRAVRQRLEDKVTVRHVADLLGYHYPVRVLDVEHQEELEGWTFGDLVDFFEDEDRLRQQEKMTTSLEQQQRQTAQPFQPPLDYREEHNDTSVNNVKGVSHNILEPRSKRKAAQKASNLLLSAQNRPRVLNQISLEFSGTALSKRVVSPQFVRDLDWIDNCWPRELRKDKQSYPSVQYYCLTSTSGSYTDFHIDMAGTSVWYHVLSGSKMFCLIAPTKQSLEKYERWLSHKNQQSIFLPDMIPTCYHQDGGVITVSLGESQTLFIPTGWIHAVYTPDDSVVLGGNFLHGLDLPLQLESTAIEDRNRVHRQFRFPYEKQMYFYAAGYYFQKLAKSVVVSPRELNNIPLLLRALESWYKEANQNEEKEQNKKGIQEAALYAAKANGCSTVEKFFIVLRNMCERALKARHEVQSDNVPKKPFVKRGLSIVMPPTQSLELPKKCEEALSSPKSPKIRLKLNFDGSASPVTPMQEAVAASAKGDTLQDDDAIRIVISSVAKELHEPMPRATYRAPPRIKEDTGFVDAAHDDEDWVPSARLKKQHGAGKQRKSNHLQKQTPAPSLASCTKTTPKNNSQPPAKRPKTTARQRLLKKFR